MRKVACAQGFLLLELIVCLLVASVALLCLAQEGPAISVSVREVEFQGDLADKLQQARAVLPLLVSQHLGSGSTTLPLLKMPAPLEDIEARCGLNAAIARCELGFASLGKTGEGDLRFNVTFPIR